MEAGGHYQMRVIDGDKVVYHESKGPPDEEAQALGSSEECGFLVEVGGRDDLFIIVWARAQISSYKIFFWLVQLKKGEHILTRQFCLVSLVAVNFF